MLLLRNISFNQIYFDKMHNVTDIKKPSIGWNTELLNMMSVYTENCAAKIS
jgi:hypothetical protein